MGNLGERRGSDLVPDLARGAVVADQLRKLRFQLGIAPHERIVLLIGNLAAHRWRLRHGRAGRASRSGATHNASRMSSFAASGSERRLASLMALRDHQIIPPNPLVQGRGGFRVRFPLLGQGSGRGVVRLQRGHQTPSSNRSACARASGVTSAPESIRAISSCRPASSSSSTLVFVTVPLEALAIR